VKEYSQGNIGRIFVVTLTEGEEVYPCLEHLARKKEIKSALVICMGGIRYGKLKPLNREFNDARELFAGGNPFLG